MLTAERSHKISQTVSDMIDKALHERGISARRVSIEVVGHDGLIRDIRAGRILSYDRVQALFDYLGLDLSMKESKPVERNPEVLVKNSDRTFPHKGFAKCSLQGWSGSSLSFEPMTRPDWVKDDSAFWVSASGPSMVPEGVWSNDYCLVSPGQPPRIGDRVYVKDSIGNAAIKRLINFDSHSITLRGWLPVVDHKQNDFIETRPSGTVANLFPVIAVYRGVNGKRDGDITFVPDPRSETQSRGDGHVVLAVLNGSVRPESRTSYPKTMGFPETWLSAKGLHRGGAALVAVSDDNMEPKILKGSVVLINTNTTQTLTKGIFAIRRNKVVLIRRLEEMGSGTLLLSGGNPSVQTSMIPPEQRKSIEILGRVVWVGQDF